MIRKQWKKKTSEKTRENLITTLHMTRFALKLVCKDKPGKIYTWIKIVLVPISSLISLIYVIVPGLIITELTEEQRIEKLIFFVSLMVLVPVLNSIINIILNKHLLECRKKIETRLYVDLYEHIYSLDYETVEDPTVQLMQDRAICTNEEIMFVIDGIMDLAKAFVNFAALCSLISRLNPLFILLIIIFVSINSAILKHVNKEKHKLNIEIDKYNRSIYGTTTVLDRFDYAPEVRLYNLFPFFIKIFIEKKGQKDAIELKRELSSNASTICSTATNFLQNIIMYIYVIYKVVERSMSVGEMTVYMSAISQFSGALSSISKIYLILASRNMKLKEYIELCELTQKQHCVGNKVPVTTQDSVIEFQNVSFKYPGSKFYAIDNLSIKIRVNEKLCIVGENGSGKSTFIKLLTRLYYPEKGEILLDGVNINQFDYREYVKLFASTLQDFNLYYLSIKENIVLDQEANQERLDLVYKQGGLRPLLQKVTQGEDTQVYKWEAIDGFQPSGGEGQRIAIARAIYRNTPILLLDEPTAALDPNAECEIYTQFHNMINSKCAILITHRLSAVQLADKVAVFADGQVAEYGTHAELYAKGGIYTEMFDKQAQFYRNEAPATENAQEQ